MSPINEKEYPCVEYALDGAIGLIHVFGFWAYRSVINSNPHKKISAIFFYSLAFCVGIYIHHLFNEHAINFKQKTVSVLLSCAFPLILIVYSILMKRQH